MKLFKLSVVVILLYQGAISADLTDYCSYKCKNGDRHTLCKFQGPSLYCQKFVHFNYTRQKEKILKYHNELRNAFAGARANRYHPPAANMMLMVRHMCVHYMDKSILSPFLDTVQYNVETAFQSWDNELEMSALRWAQQCTASSVERDSCRDLRRFKVGQNIALLEGNNLKALKRIPVRRLFKQWADQWGSLHASTIARYSKHGPDVSELAQALWATTTRVGCADVIYGIADGKYFRHLVCNYGPAGNLLGRSVYIIGNPCSSCPVETECIFGRLPYLCVGPK